MHVFDASFMASEMPENKGILFSCLCTQDGYSARDITVTWSVYHLQQQTLAAEQHPARSVSKHGDLLLVLRGLAQ